MQTHSPLTALNPHHLLQMENVLTCQTLLMLREPCLGITRAVSSVVMPLQASMPLKGNVRLQTEITTSLSPRPPLMWQKGSSQPPK